MKQLFGTLLALCLLLTGCATMEVLELPTPTITPKAEIPQAVQTPLPTKPLAAQKFQYDPYLIAPYIKQYVKPNEQAYKKLFDAVDAYQERVDVQEYDLNAEDGIALSRAIFDRSEFEYLRSVRLSKDAKTMEISYTMPKDEAMKAKQAYRDKVNYLLTEVASPAYNDLENVLALYEYLTKNTLYTQESQGGLAFDVLVNGWGLCTGYAYNLQYLLDQLGIESHLAYSDDGAHIWNIVNINGQYYHIDATFDSSGENSSLFHFGMTDASKKATSDFPGWHSGNSNYAQYDSPACEDTTFSFLMNANDRVLDLDNHTLTYTDASDNREYVFDTQTKATTTAD